MIPAMKYYHDHEVVIILKFVERGLGSNLGLAPYCGKSLNRSVPQSPYLENENNNHTTSESGEE